MSPNTFQDGCRHRRSRSQGEKETRTPCSLPPSRLPLRRTDRDLGSHTSSSSRGGHCAATEAACQGKQPRIMVDLPSPPKPNSQPAPVPGSRCPSEPGGPLNQASGAGTHTLTHTHAYTLATFSTKRRIWNSVSDSLRSSNILKGAACSISAPPEQTPIPISTLPALGHTAGINHRAGKSAGMAGSFVLLKFLSFPKQLLDLIKRLKTKKDNDEGPFRMEEAGTHCSTAHQTKRPQAGPTRVGTSGPDPGSPVAASQTLDRLAVTCCRHLSGTGAGQRGTFKEPGLLPSRQTLPAYLPKLHGAHARPPPTELRGAVTIPYHR